MRYSLMVYKNYEFSFVKGFSKLAEYSDLDETSLKDIVHFTNSFQNSDELTEILFYNGKISQKFLGGTFHISYRKGKSPTSKILQYGISFKQDRKFFEPAYLNNYYAKKLTDPIFMDEFIHKYFSYLNDTIAFGEDLRIIRISHLNKYLTNDTYRSMNNFINKYIYVKDSKGNRKLSYSRLRDLAMFAINYERTYNRKKENSFYKNPNFIKTIKNELKYYEAKINEQGITQEEYIAYAKKISELETEIEHLQEDNQTLERKI